MKSITIDLSANDILCLINSISFTMQILNEGVPERFFNYYQKREYIEHYNELSFLRGRLQTKGNSRIYGCDYHMYWGQYIYFSENKSLKSYYKNHNKYLNTIEQYKLSSVKKIHQNLLEEKKKKYFKMRLILEKIRNVNI